MDIENILNKLEKLDGFYVKQDGTRLFLCCGNINIAQFCIDDFSESELKEKIHSFIGLNRIVMMSCENKICKIYDDAIKQIKGEVCFTCGKNCMRPCKFVLTMLDRIFEASWLNYVSQN